MGSCTCKRKKSWQRGAPPPTLCSYTAPVRALSAHTSHVPLQADGSKDSPKWASSCTRLHSTASSAYMICEGRGVGVGGPGVVYAWPQCVAAGCASESARH